MTDPSPPSNEPAPPAADDATAGASPPAGDAAPAGAQILEEIDLSPPREFTVLAALAAFAIGLALALGVYVAVNHGSLAASAAPQSWDASKMSVPRGTGRLEGGTLVAQAPANDLLIVSLPTDFRARDLSAVSWDVVDVPPGADVRLLFSSDYRPRRVESRPLAVEDGRVLPATLAGDPDWLGRITGLAIAVRAPGATVRVRGVAVKSQSAMQLVRDRAGEWFRFEPWSGTSINSVTGGAPAQSLPLPVPVAIAALLAFGMLVAARRFAPARFPRTAGAMAMLVFFVAWAVLDARWTVNLARQVAETVQRYGGKDPADRARAAEDGDLAAFLDRAKARMPAEPQRVVVLAQAHYYRGRAGWHLLPHRALWEPVRDVPPEAGLLRPGDFVVVWQRPGIQFDAASGRLRFENGVDLPAKLVLAERGAALFAIL